MQSVSQSPTDPAFVQDPYAFYDRARAKGAVVYWEEYGMPVVLSFAGVNAALRDRRMGRAPLSPPEWPPHLADFTRVEQQSLLELEPPRHTALRRLALAGFTSARIAALAPGITQLSHDLIDAFPDGPFDLLPAFAQKLPVIVICRLLGVPEAMADQLLDWSHRMVAMYQARRDRAVEEDANSAAADFADFLRGHIEARRADPADDLITRLIAAEETGESLDTDALIGTCVLLLNAGHEATVQSLGNGVKTLLEHGPDPAWLSEAAIPGTVEEILRHDPPLHMFTRWTYEDLEIMGREIPRGTEVGLLLGAANRDPKTWDDPHRFDPTRPLKPHTAFGAGLHFCLGAPLARLEFQIALPILFARCPTLCLAETPRYADLYHFHGLERLMVTR